MYRTLTAILLPGGSIWFPYSWWGLWTFKHVLMPCWRRSIHNGDRPNGSISMGCYTRLGVTWTLFYIPWWWRFLSGHLSLAFSSVFLNLVLDLWDRLGESGHVLLLLHQVGSIYYNLGHEDYVGVSKVCHCSHFLWCCPCKVGKCLLYFYRVFVSIAALARRLLALSEMCLGLYEVVLKDCTRIIFD